MEEFQSLIGALTVSLNDQSREIFNFTTAFTWSSSTKEWSHDLDPTNIFDELEEEITGEAVEVQETEDEV